jgi:hypothetical protein
LLVSGLRPLKPLRGKAHEGRKVLKIRNRKITVRLTDTEREHLQLQADLTGLKVEPFVRNLIMGSDMKARPQEEWAELLRQASGIAANVNQVSKKANSGAPVTEETLRLILDMQNQIWAKLKEF